MNENTIRSKSKALIKMAISGAVFSGLIVTAVAIFSYPDQTEAVLKERLRDSREVIAIVGMIESVKTLRFRHAFASPSRPEAKTYLFAVNGTKGVAYTRIRAVRVDPDGEFDSVEILSVTKK
ncbi:MAG: hypothetical protein ACRBC3_18400 [Burkholderiaceae bacterium]